MAEEPARLVAVLGYSRTRGRGLSTDAFSWIGSLSGQMLFSPPNVAGWDESRWLDTATFRGRWIAANYSLAEDEIDPQAGTYDVSEDAGAAVATALGFWGTPQITPETRDRLLAFSTRCQTAMNARWKQQSYRALRQNALRMLVATSPDMQTC